MKVVRTLVGIIISVCFTVKFIPVSAESCCSIGKINTLLYDYGYNSTEISQEDNFLRSANFSGAQLQSIYNEISTVLADTQYCIDPSLYTSSQIATIENDITKFDTQLGYITRFGKKGHNTYYFSLTNGDGHTTVFTNSVPPDASIGNIVGELSKEGYTSNEVSEFRSFLKTADYSSGQLGDILAGIKNIYDNYGNLSNWNKLSYEDAQNAEAAITEIGTDSNFCYNFQFSKNATGGLAITVLNGTTKVAKFTLNANVSSSYNHNSGAKTSVSQIASVPVENPKTGNTAQSPIFLAGFLCGTAVTGFIGAKCLKGRRQKSQ